MTGSFLSARFPFISPGGKMGAGYHFIDGGGKDNSGASTSDLIYSTLARYAATYLVGEHPAYTDTLFISLVKKLRFYFVSISNSPHKIETRKLVENRMELISPLVGIINSGIDGNAQAADNTLLSRYGRDNLKHQGFITGYFALYPTIDCIMDSAGKVYSPVLPLGWQISAPALERLQATFNKANLPEMGPRGVLGILRLMVEEKK